MVQPVKAFGIYLRPFASTNAFGQLYPTAIECSILPVLSSSLLPAFTDRELITTTDSSATPHHFVPPLCLHLFELTLHLGWCRASPVKYTCLNSNTSVLTPQVIQLLGFPTFCKVTHLESQPRFACAMFQIPPSASFRTHRWPVTYLLRGCLPAG